MFSSKYKANIWAMNPDVFLYDIIKSEGESPPQQAELIATAVVLLGMGKKICNVSTDSSTFSYIYCIYFFF